MMGGHGYGMGMGWGWGWIIGLILIIAIVYILVRTINQGNNRTRSNEKSPMDILKERYARGEIDKEEFEERKKQLR